MRANFTNLFLRISLVKQQTIAVVFSLFMVLATTVYLWANISPIKPVDVTATADQASNLPTAAFVNIGDVVLREEANKDFSSGNYNLVISVTGNWRFNPNSATSVLLRSPGGNVPDNLRPTISADFKTLTFSLNVSNGSNFDVVTISGIQVQPLSGAVALPSAGIVYIAGNANIAGLTSNTTVANLSMTNGAAKSISFTTQPGGALTGNPLTPQPVLTLRDQFNNVVSTGAGATSSVSIAFGSNPGAGVLAGDVTINAVNGVATFTNLNISNAGQGYTLVAASGSLPTETSTAFNITNRKPVISSLSQTCSSVGDGAFTLTINGNDFANGAVVRVTNPSGATTELVPSSITKTVIQVPVPETAFAVAGGYVIHVINRSANQTDVTSDGVGFNVYTVLVQGDITGSIEPCAGTAATYTAPAGYTDYNWSVPAGIGSVTSGQGTRSAIITYTDAAVGASSVSLSAVNGCAKTSTTSLSITVKAKPVITLSSDVVICKGESTTLTANGAETYTWSPAIGLSATSGASVIANPIATTTYTVTGITNGCQSDVRTVTVTVTEPITQGAISGSTNLCQGGATSALTATVAGGDGAGTYTYLWEQSNSTSGPWNAATGTNNQASYSPSTAVDGTFYFRRTVKSGACESINAPIAVTISPAITSNNIQGTQKVCSGNPVAPLTGTVTGGTGTFTFLWEQSSSTTGPWNAATGDNSKLDYQPATQTVSSKVTTYYRRTVSSGNCTSISEIVSVEINPLPVAVITQGANTYFCSPGSATLTAQSGTEYTYVWKKVGENGGPDTDAGSTGSINVSTVGNYYVIVTDGNNCTSTSASISVQETIVGNNILNSQDQLICYNAVPGSLDGSSATSTVGPLSYQWEVSSDNSTFIAITGATNEDLTPAQMGSLTADRWYRRTATVGSCSSTSKETIKISVRGEIINSLTTTELAVCLNGSPKTITGSPVTGGTGSYTYLWQQSTSLTGPWATIDGATNVDFTPSTAPVGTTYYRRIVVSGDCEPVASNIARFTINSLPETAITAESVTTFCQGGSVVLSAPEGPYSYQWLRNGAAITEAGTARKYTAIIAGDYTVRVTNTETTCTATTPTATTVTVNPQPTVTAAASPAIKCVGENNTTIFDLTGTATNGTPAWSFVSATGSATVSSFSSPNTGNTQVTVKGTGSVIVRLTSSSTVASCNDATKDITLTVNPNPIANAGADMELCVGSNNTTTFERNASGSEGTVSWTVKSKTEGVEVTNLAYPFLFNSFVTVTGIGTAVLTLTVTKDGCSTSDDVILTVKPRPTVNTVDNKIYCHGTPGEAINFGSSLAGSTFTWTSSVNVGFGTSGTGNIPAYTATNTSTAPVTATVRVIATVNGCPSPEQSFTITVNPTPKLTSTLTPAALCSETAFSYTPTSATSGTTFSWTRAAVEGISNPAASGNGGISETLVNTTATDKTVVYVYTITANGCTNTQNVSVIVKPKPTPIISNITEGQLFYSGDANITLVGSPTGGTFSGIGVAGTTFSPCDAFKNAPAGATEMNVAITYTVTVNGCTNSVTRNVKIKKSIYKVIVTADPHPFCQGQNVHYVAKVYRDAEVIYPYLVNELGQPVDKAGNVIPSGAGSFPVANPNYPFPAGTPQIVKEQAFRYFQPIVVSGTLLNRDLFNYQWTKNEKVDRKNDAPETDDAGLSSQDYYGVKVTSKTGAICDAVLTNLMSYRVYSADLPDYEVTLAVSPVPMCTSGPVTLTATLDGDFAYWAIINLKLEFILTRGSTTYNLGTYPYNGTNTVQFTYDPASIGGFIDGDKIQVNYISDVDEAVKNTKCAGKTISNIVTIIVEQPATVTTDLTAAPITKCEGESTSFTVSGKGTNLQFNWFKEGTASAIINGGRFSIVNTTANGVTTSTLTITDLQKSDAGMYYAELQSNSTTTACRTIASTTKQQLIVNAMPDAQVMVGGEFCPYSAEGVVLTLNGSEQGMSYELLKDGQPLNPRVVMAGTGGALNFGTYTEGNYTVVGTGEGTCVNNSVATATIINNLDPTKSPAFGELVFEYVPENSWKFTALETNLSSDTESFGANPTFVWFTKAAIEPEEAWKEFATTKENTLTIQNGEPGTEVKVEVTVTDGRCQRYVMITGTAVPFPVELIEFNAIKRGSDVELKWSTAMEKDNTGFEVQVSEDGSQFRKLNFVPSLNGNSSMKQSYSYTDKERNKRLTRHYRLKQIDVDGKVEYYGPVSVHFGEVSERMTAYPNPFSKEVYLDIETETAGPMEVTMSDVTGKRLLSTIIEVQQGKGTYKIELDPATPLGAYFITTRKGNEVKHFKLIKQ